MKGTSGSLLALSFLAMPIIGQANQLIVPAGTLLHCTVSEPNFSSKTAEVGDPLLCQTGPLEQFGQVVFPAAASLVGRFAEYRKPGHFVGKGWMQINFDRVVLSDRVLPVSAKVIQAPRVAVDAKGRMHGLGHARRDAVEWLFPPLWPWKAVALPLRGPAPAMKGESRITLKLMDDLVVPGAGGGMETPLLRPSLRPGRFSGPTDFTPVETANNRPTDSPENAARPAVFSLPSDSQRDQNIDVSQAKLLTLLVLKDGTARAATDYWFEDGQWIRYRPIGGTLKSVSISRLDYPATVETNRQRGVEFVVRSQNAGY
jgi:hypothetical protein